MNIGRVGICSMALEAQPLSVAREAVAETGSSTRLSPGRDVEDVRRRVKEHLDAGADHVALQVLTDNPAALPVRE